MTVRSTGWELFKYIVKWGKKRSYASTSLGVFCNNLIKITNMPEDVQSYWPLIINNILSISCLLFRYRENKRSFFPTKWGKKKSLWGKKRSCFKYNYWVCNCIYLQLYSLNLNILPCETQGTDIILNEP